MPPQCDVLVLRHGESTANVDGELVGRRDPLLTGTGRRQAEAAAAYLRRLVPAATGAGSGSGSASAVVVVSSPLLRASQTAAFAAEAFGAGVTSDDRLVELDYGDLEGTPFADLLPGWPPDWIADPTVAVPGGESIAAMAQRVYEATRDHAAVAVAREASLIVVTHLGPTKSLVAAATGDLAGAQSLIHIAPASITRLGLDPESGAATLVALNLTAL